MIEFIWGTNTRVYTPPIFPLEPITVGFIKISNVYLWSFILAILLFVIFAAFFKYSHLGSGHAGDC